MQQVHPLSLLHINVTKDVEQVKPLEPTLGEMNFQIIQVMH